MTGDEDWKEFVLAITQAESVRRVEKIQTLWSGYGEIVRIALTGFPEDTLIVKSVTYPSQLEHPRGWATTRSHERKLRSYEVEQHWYSKYAERCDPHCRVARCYGVASQHSSHWILLEDLDAPSPGPSARQALRSYSARYTRLSLKQAEVCLSFLAAFHAKFLGFAEPGLWPVGSYWHLHTRPDELAAMTDLRLQAAAPALDELLNTCTYQTVIHGDAKVANFCFSEDASRVAMVDFQYVGRGCGMRDVAYFLGSCLSESDCEQHHEALLAFYFDSLSRFVSLYGREVDFSALEEEWRAMFPVAWTDFYRFLQGWMPEHQKIHGFTRKLAAITYARLGL